MLDSKARRAVVAAGQLQKKDMHEVQPHAAKATLFSLESWGDVLLQADQVSPSKDVFHGFELWIAGDALYGAQIDVGYAPEVQYFHWTSAGRKQIGWTHEDTERRTPPKEVPLSQPSLHVVELAEARAWNTSKARVRKGIVTIEGVDGTVKLDKGHHQVPRIYASPDPMVFVVASNTIRFSTDGMDEDTPTTRERHVVDLVDMHAETATRLAFDKGYAHVAWAPDGTLFLDTPTGVHRYAPGMTTPVADVPAGIRFGTPPFPEEGGV
jgi:hypothetical protein